LAKEGFIGFFARFMMPWGALVASARLEAAVERGLLIKMRPLSKTRRANLFEGYGPLASFAGKIDIAYALGIFDDETYADLKVIKRIRNEFAHPRGRSTMRQSCLMETPR
jgi:hypothetical protein